MSTKIYNGYKSNLGMSELLSKFRDLRTIFEDIDRKWFLNDVVNKTISEIDWSHFNNKPFNQADIWKNVLEKRKEDALKPFGDRQSISACVYPLKQDETLILFFDNRLSEILNIWNGLDFVTEYHYQNSTDKPESISETEWDIRRSSWELALKSGTPIYDMYQYRFVSKRIPHIFFSKKLVEEIMESFTRIARATDVIKHDFINKKAIELGFDSAKGNYSVFGDALQSWVEERNSESILKQIKEEESSLPELEPFNLNAI